MAFRRSKTGGGVGTNQYGRKGVSKQQQPPRPTVSMTSAVSGGAVTADPFGDDMRLPDPEADAHAEKIWRGETRYGVSEEELRRSIATDLLRLERLDPRQHHGQHIDNPRAERERLTARIMEAERDLASRGRTNVQNQKLAALAVERRKEGERFSDVLGAVPPGPVPSDGTPVDLLANQRTLVTWGPDTTPQAATRTAADPAAGSDPAAWRQVADATAPMCEDVARQAANAAKRNRDPLRKAAEASTAWLADRGIEGRATVDTTHSAGPRVVVELL